MMDNYSDGSTDDYVYNSAHCGGDMISVNDYVKLYLILILNSKLINKSNLPAYDKHFIKLYITNFFQTINIKNILEIKDIPQICKNYYNRINKKIKPLETSMEEPKEDVTQFINNEQYRTILLGKEIDKIKNEEKKLELKFAERIAEEDEEIKKRILLEEEKIKANAEEEIKSREEAKRIAEANKVKEEKWNQTMYKIKIAGGIIAGLAIIIGLSYGLNKHRKNKEKHKTHHTKDTDDN